MKTGQLSFAFALVAAFGATAVASPSLTPDDAKRAGDALQRGGLVAEQGEDGTSVYIIRDITPQETADGRVRLEVRAEALAKATLDCCGNASWEILEAGKQSVVTINLAKSYVTSAEVPGMMINLGKKIGMRLKCPTIAFEIPSSVIRAAATRAQASSKASAPRPQPAESSSPRRRAVRVS